MKPNFIYGTAWKEDLTETCVMSALRAGFRAIDTANQRKHYYEEGVGRALAAAYKSLPLKREDIFLQTKFTFARGQDHRKPYEDNAPIAEQVQQSFLSSLEHLGTDYLDSLLLHGPSTGGPLVATDWEAWGALEKLAQAGQVRTIGISNVNLEQLQQLCSRAVVKPSYVQNRCYAEMAWDYHVRQFCLQNQIRYQGFSLLTANSHLLGGQVIQAASRKNPQLVFESAATVDLLSAIQKRTGKTTEQIIFRFCQQIGMLPITGTQDPAHMARDLDITNFDLSPEELESIEELGL